MFAETAIIRASARRQLAWWGLILMMILLPGVAGAEAIARQAGAEDGQTFRINLSVGGYPPYLMVNADGSPAGLLWEVLERTLGDQQLVVSEIPRKRVDGFILDGAIDGTFRATEWTAEAHRYIFSDPIVQVRDVIFSPRQRPIVFEGPESLHGKRIIAHLGYGYPSLEPAFAGGQAERHDLSDERDMFRRLLSGNRYDGLVIGERVGNWLIQQEGWVGQFVNYPITEATVAYRLMMAPANEATMRLFNQRLAALQASGELATILRRYGSRSMAKSDARSVR